MTDGQTVKRDEEKTNNKITKGEKVQEKGEACPARITNSLPNLFLSLSISLSLPLFFPQSLNGWIHICRC